MKITLRTFRQTHASCQKTVYRPLLVTCNKSDDFRRSCGQKRFRHFRIFALDLLTFQPPKRSGATEGFCVREKYAMCDSATSATSNNMKLVHGCMGLLHLVQRGEDRTGSQPTQALLAVPNVTAHPSTASVPITVLLLGGFNAPVKGLILRTLAVVNTKTENPPKLFPGDRGEDIAT